MRSIRATALLALVTAGISAVSLGAPPASASIEQPRLVNDNPANFTPNVTNGRVLAVTQVGNTIVLGGTFSTVQNSNRTTTYNRSRLVAFDAASGQVSSTFTPTPNNTVEALAAAADGTSVYVGGRFKTIDGATARRIVRLRISDGSIMSSFNARWINGKVKDLKVVGDTVYISGNFSKVAGQPRAKMASLDATTGALTNKLDLPFAGVNNGGGTSVNKFDLTPDGTRLVAIGNFATLDGQPRHQVAMIDTSGPTATVANWSTDRFPNQCARVFNTYLRDLDFSPAGDYFILSTTGAYRGAGSTCDSISRWETSHTGDGQVETWIDHTGGDTTYAVAATGAAVYAGGHFRWLNNSYAGDRAGPGAVPHSGIVALDPSNGLPFSWAGRRARGVGVFDMLATDQGLWLGSDTNWFGGERRMRVTFLPLAGGTTVPDSETPQLPGTAVQLGRIGGGAADEVSLTPLSGTGVPGSTTTVAGNDAFHNARGAFVVNSTLYTPWADGSLRARTMSGSALGAARTVDLYGGTFIADAPNVTGIVFDPATSRVYYTLSGDGRLFWRWFTPESEVMGAVRYEASAGSLPAAQVGGMFASGGSLYYADRDNGDLYRVGFDTGVTGAFGPGVTGSPSLVDSSRAWEAPGLTLGAP